MGLKQNGNTKRKHQAETQNGNTKRKHQAETPSHNQHFELIDLIMFVNF
jgi:hypothetical protein